MKKAFLITFIVVAMMFTYGCQTTVETDDIDMDKSISEEIDNEIKTIDEKIVLKVMPSSQLRDEMITEVLETAFTVKEDDYHEKTIDYTFIYEERHNKVENFFTEKGFDRIMRSRMMVGLMYAYVEYYCSSTIDNIELEFRETSNIDQVVCYYKFNLNVAFIDASIEPFKREVTGEMTLQVSDEDWKIDFFTINSFRSYNSSFRDYVKLHNIGNFNDNVLDSLMVRVINELSSNSGRIQIQYQEDESFITTFENAQIKSGKKEGEYFSIVNYDNTKINLSERSILFHIVSEVDFNYDQEDQKLLEADYFDKIIINEDGLTYMYKYDSDEMIESQWYYIKE